MSENLLPCLKEHNWPGSEHTICRALLGGVASVYMPWLAFGWDHPHTFEFANSDKAKGLGLSDEAIEAQALANLRSRSATWQPLATDVAEGKQLKMLICADDFFAAERIIDAAFMLEAQRQLGASGLLVGIPRRGFMMATGLEQDQQLHSAFSSVVAGEFSRGESAVISPMVFIVTDGAIVAFSETMAEVMAKRAEEEAGDEPEDDPLAPYIGGMVTKNAQGTQDVHIMAGGEDGDRLVRGIEEAFHQVLKEHLANKEFSGNIRIVVFGYTPLAAQAGLASMLEHLRGIVSEMLGHGVTPIHIELEIQKDSPFGSGASASPANSPPKPNKRGAGFWITILFFAALILYALLGR